uniref:SHSP domain-containing protein n=1 Tax=Bracon brevicornis TaxID=1563983 RepID=A0A6V7KW71_9HYME
MPLTATLHDWWNDLSRLRGLDQCVGPPIEEISEDHLHHPHHRRYRRRYHPLHHVLHSRRHRRNPMPRDNGDKFVVSFDVHQFAADEINVKLVDTNNLVIEARHEEKEDEHGWVAREFVRRCIIPEAFDPEKVESHLSNDGVLFILVPRKKAGVQSERIIPIEYTGLPAVFHGNQEAGEREHPQDEPEREERRINVSVSAA